MTDKPLQPLEAVEAAATHRVGDDGKVYGEPSTSIEKAAGITFTEQNFTKSGGVLPGCPADARTITTLAYAKRQPNQRLIQGKDAQGNIDSVSLLVPGNAEFPDCDWVVLLGAYGPSATQQSVVEQFKQGLVSLEWPSDRDGKMGLLIAENSLPSVQSAAEEVFGPKNVKIETPPFNPRVGIQLHRVIITVPTAPRGVVAQIASRFGK